MRTSSARLPPESEWWRRCSCAAPRPAKPRLRSRWLLRDRLDALRDFLSGGVGRARLHGHELRHVALDLDLAGHEGLHPGLRVLVDDDRLGRLVVERDGEVGV